MIHYIYIYIYCDSTGTMNNVQPSIVKPIDDLTGTIPFNDKILITMYRYCIIQ